MHYTDRGYDLTVPGLSPQQIEVLSFPEEFVNESRNSKKGPAGDWEYLPAGTEPKL
jgi:hypothetical protein